MKHQTIKLNGVEYDARTGMRITPRQQPERQSPSHAHAVHARTQRSKTLNRKIVNRKTSVKVETSATARPVTKHPKVRKFADVQPTRHQTAAHKQAQQAPDIAPQLHPAAAKAHAHAAKKQAPAAKKAPTAADLSAAEIKQRVVSESLKNAPSHHAKKPVRTKKRGRFSSALSVASAGFALLLLAGYFTYLNMPNLSVRVAAAQAGINATYPGYKPDGYNLAGRIAYNTGQVSMKFASTSSPANFTVVQARTDWDSSAVEQNYAREKWGDDVTTTIDRGLTIYSHGGEAAWVNGGILYTISGDAPLSTSQLTRLATSM